MKIKGKQNSEPDGLIGMAPEGSHLGCYKLPSSLLQTPFCRARQGTDTFSWYFTVYKSLSYPLTL